MSAAAVFLALLAGMQAAPAPPIASHFECDMRRGDFTALDEASRISDDDRRYLPERWRVTIAVPAEHGDRVAYADDVLGRPIDVLALWGYRRSHFWGNGKLVDAEYDWWGVDYSVIFTAAGEALITNRYLRTKMQDGHPRSVELDAIGDCHEIVSFPVRNPS